MVKGHSDNQGTEASVIYCTIQQLFVLSWYPLFKNLITAVQNESNWTVFWQSHSSQLCKSSMSDRHLQNAKYCVISFFSWTEYSPTSLSDLPFLPQLCSCTPIFYIISDHWQWLIKEIWFEEMDLLWRFQIPWFSKNVQNIQNPRFFSSRETPSITAWFWTSYVLQG